MKTPTIGYECDVRISKSKIAKIQLVEAISLFLVGKYLCAITLSGAAEEIFARLLNACGEMSAVESSIESIQNIRKKTSLDVMQNMSKKDIFNQWNRARNALKHYDGEGDVFVTINLFDEAYWLIRRALSNADILDIFIENKMDFENWMIVNITN